MDMQAVAVGLATAAGTVSSTPAMIVTPYTPDSVEVPACFVAEYDIDFDAAMGRGLDTATVTVRVLIGRADDKSSSVRLNALLSGGTGSLKAAIESDRRHRGGTGLAGACDDYHVQAVQGMRWYIHNQITYLGAEFRVRVIGSGS